MEGFGVNDDVVETNCKHVFHKSCCRQWLRQSRTCPVCRDDIPLSLADNGTTAIEDEDEDAEGGHATDSDTDRDGAEPSRIPMGPTGRPVRGLIRMLAPTSNRPPTNSGNNEDGGHQHHHTNVNTATSAATAVGSSDLFLSDATDIEQGSNRARRLYTSDF